MIAATYGSPVATAKIKVVNGNRIALQNDDGIIYDFTNSGTAPLNLNLGTVLERSMALTLLLQSLATLSRLHLLQSFHRGH